MLLVLCQFRLDRALDDNGLGMNIFVSTIGQKQ